MVTVTRVTMRVVSLTATVSTTGHQVVSSRETLRLVCDVDKVYGSGAQDLAISMRGNGSMTKSKDMECLLGLTAVYIRATT